VEWGSYIVEVVDKDTNAISSVRFYAGYSWQNDNTDKIRPEQVKLKLDKSSYKAGDIAKVTVESLESGDGYINVETNDGILWWQNIHVGKNGRIILIPVSKEWTKHDIYINVVVIKKESGKNLTPKRAIGFLHLPLFRDDRKIDIALKVPEKIVPKEKVKVLLKANLSQKQKGKKLKAIVSAADSGILSITDFQTPNPFETFFAKREWNTDIYDVYGNLIEGNGKNASLKFGGDAALLKMAGGKKPLTEILLVAMQSNSVTLNENGEAEVEFDIPDFNGELRFMVQAWGDEDYGGDEQKAIAALPVVVELNHPRFLASSDKSTLALDVNNLSGLEQKLKVHISAAGYLDGFKEEQIVISDRQRKTIYIPISAQSGFGSGTVTVKVSGIDGQPKNIIEKKWTIGVRAPYPANVFKLFKELKKNDVIKPSDFEEGYKNIDERTVDALITISSIPPINFAQAIKELFAYPYGCVEQTTSGIYPSIYTSSEQLEALGIKTSSNEERKKNVEQGIKRLLGMQKTNGSFGYWGDDYSEAHWASVYVTDFLLRAKEQGYYVPKDALEKAIERLQYYINSGSVDYGYSYDFDYTNFAVKSYAAFVLAREQKANLGNLRRLYDLSNNTQSSLALMQLGIALKLMGDNERADNLINKAVLFKAERHNYYWYGDYGSNVRDKALILSLLYEHDLLPKSRAEIVLSLSEQIKSKSYFSTQERNAIFLAGRHFVNAKEPSWQAIIDANGKKETVKPDGKPFVRELNFTKLNSIQSIKNNGETTIFTSIDITGYPKSAPTPASNNIDISRSYYTLDGKETVLSELKSGDLVIVALNVKTNLNRISDALVVDLLPAGLELENQNLGHSININDSEALKSNKDLTRQAAATTIIHQEFRDDRYVAAIDIGRYEPATLVYLVRAVSPGIYTVPPPYAQSMYSPEIFAIGSSIPKLTVK
jgi:uncharacterized protein YfaS (alpha-2-macroglobulin family)